MKSFLETTFEPGDLRMVETVLDEWRGHSLLPRDHPDSEIAAAILLCLFRAGNHTVAKLQAAASQHRGLLDLAAAVSRDGP